MILSELKPTNEGETYVFDLVELNKILKQKSDDYEKLEYLESEKTKHLELANHCQLHIDKIKKLHKYKKEYHPRPSSPALQAEMTEEPKKTEPEIKSTKSFPQFLLHEKQEVLAEKLKMEFKTEKGKKMRLIVETMQSHDPALISVGSREKNSLYLAMKTFFSHDIGSYQSIFDYNFSAKTDKEDLKSIETRINFLLESL
jgi:hypothetical protein